MTTPSDKIIIDAVLSGSGFAKTTLSPDGTIQTQHIPLSEILVMTTPDIKLLKELTESYLVEKDKLDFKDGNDFDEHMRTIIHFEREAPRHITALCERVETAEALLKSVAELGLRESNGGRDNAISNIHDAATVVRRVRAALKGEP
jgi:hypothetical protein